MPVSSPVAGVIEEILIPDGDKVTAGSVLCRINVTGVFSFNANTMTVLLSAGEFLQYHAIVQYVTFSYTDCF